MFQCNGLHSSEIQNRETAIEVEGSDSYELMKEGEEKRLRTIGFYDFWTATGSNYFHSPLNSIKNVEMVQNPSLFPPKNQQTWVHKEQDPYASETPLKKTLRNPRTASMAKKGASMRAERVPFLQNLPLRSNHLQVIYNDRSYLSMPTNLHKTIHDATITRQTIEHKIATNAWPPAKNNKKQNTNTSKIPPKSNIIPTKNKNTTYNLKHFPDLFKTIKILRLEGWLCSFNKDDQLIILHGYGKDPMASIMEKTLQIEKLEKDKSSLKRVNKMSLERYEQMRNVNLDLNIKLDKLAQDLCASSENALSLRDDLGLILQQFHQLTAKICSEICMLCKNNIEQDYLKNTADLVEEHKKALERATLTDSNCDSIKKLVKDCVGSLSTRLDNIKKDLQSKLKKELDTLKGENVNLSENQKARRAKKHAKNKTQDTKITLDEDIIKFLIIQNAMQGVTNANIQEQKTNNAKIAEQILNESNWSEDYYPDHDQTESMSEITTSTVSELEESHIDDVDSSPFKIKPRNNKQDDTTQQCPLLLTMAKSSICTNFLEVIEQIPKLELKETKTSGQGLSEVDKIFKEAGLSSQDFLSDSSGEIITIEEEEAQEDQSVEIITIVEEEEEDEE